MKSDLESSWSRLLNKISEDFNLKADLNGILFLIGIQERGEGCREYYSKKDKIELINMALCKLLSSLGYYTIKSYDRENWPVFEKNKTLPPFSDEIKQQLLKSVIVAYFKENGYLQ